MKFELKYLSQSLFAWWHTYTDAKFNLYDHYARVHGGYVDFVTRAEYAAHYVNNGTYNQVFAGAFTLWLIFLLTVIAISMRVSRNDADAEDKAFVFFMSLLLGGIGCFVLMLLLQGVMFLVSQQAGVFEAIITVIALIAGTGWIFSRPDLGISRLFAKVSERVSMTAMYKRKSTDALKRAEVLEKQLLTTPEGRAALAEVERLCDADEPYRNMAGM